MRRFRSIRIKTNIGQPSSNHIFELKKSSEKEKLVFIQIDKFFKY